MNANEGSIPWRSAKLRGILACTLVLPLGVALLSPVLPIFRDAFDLTELEASLLFTLYFLPAIVLSPVLGMIADRYGRRRVLVPSLVVYGLVGMLIAFIDSVALILSLRLLQGAAAAGVFILTVTFISDVFDGVQRNAVLGANAATLALGAAIFPFLGGLLANIDWHMPFFTYVAALPVALYAYIRLDEPPLPESRTSVDYLRNAVAAIPKREMAALYGSALFLELVAFGGVLTVLPFLLTAKFDAPPILTGLSIMSMMLVAAVISLGNGRLVERRSNHRLIVVSFLTYSLGFLMIVVAPAVHVVFVGVGVIGIGFGLVHPCVDAGIGRIVPPEYLGGALSIRSSTTFLGRASGPIGFAAVGQIAGYEPVLFTAGVIALVVGGVGLLLTDSEPMVVQTAVDEGNR